MLKERFAALASFLSDLLYDRRNDRYVTARLAPRPWSAASDRRGLRVSGSAGPDLTICEIVWMHELS